MTTKILEKIVSYKVVADEKESTISDQNLSENVHAKASETLHENLDRPDMLVGSTYKIKPAISEHAFYITINDIVLNEGTEHMQQRPFEIFINSKNMEHYAWVVALTRVMSAVFRKGGDATFLVEELKAVFDPKGGYFQPGTGVFMPSLVAEIGQVVERHMKRIGLLASSDNNVSQSFPPEAVSCVKCYQKSVIKLDGCMTCLNCGDSKCG